MIIKRFKSNQNENETVNIRFKIIFKEFKDDWASNSYYVIFVSRRFIIAASSFFINSGSIQLIISSAINILV